MKVTKGPQLKEWWFSWSLHRFSHTPIYMIYLWNFSADGSGNGATLSSISHLKIKHIESPPSKMMEVTTPKTAENSKEKKAQATAEATVHPQSSTVRPWKMVGKEDKPFLLGWNGNFSGAMSVKLQATKPMGFFDVPMICCFKPSP